MTETFPCGHPRDRANTYRHGSKSPYCRQCKLAAQALSRAAKRNALIGIEKAFVAANVVAHNGRAAKAVEGRSKVRVSELIAKASELSGVTEARIRSAHRARDVVRVRAAVCLAAHECGHSYPRIGQLMGGRDHSTIIHACKIALGLIETTPEFADLVDQLRALSDAKDAEPVEVIEDEPEAEVPEALLLEHAILTRKRPKSDDDWDEYEQSLTHDLIALGSMKLRDAILQAYPERMAA